MKSLLRLFIYLVAESDILIATYNVLQWLIQPPPIFSFLSCIDFSYVVPPSCTTAVFYWVSGVTFHMKNIIVII